MHNVSMFRLNLLRGMYLLIVVGLALVVWPGLLNAGRWDLWVGVTQCMLVAFSLMCALGVRYPLQMLPVLLWEIVWKAMWLGLVAVPQWMAGTMDEATWGIAAAALWVVIVPFTIPWKYVLAHYIKKPMERAGGPVLSNEAAAR